MLVNEVVECAEVAGFLVEHVGHEGAEVRVSADEGACLRGVDEGGGKFAGLVDAELRVFFALISFAGHYLTLRDRIA